ncbi:MAG: DUF917 family protein [Ardenticatenaceae bacterium]|nr:DUF917 family protein [Ardenticatenaceae bacterium]
MAQRINSYELLEAAVLGGALLGGGGGGLMQDGLALGNQALEHGGPLLIDPEELPPDSILLTVSAVGAPSAPNRFVSPQHYVRAVEYFSRVFEMRVDGLIANENGGLATINGWLQSAALGIPVVDAPCNGRAHPTGLMGSMGLDAIPEYISRQVAIGGASTRGAEIVVAVEGGVQSTSTLIRAAAVTAGGLVAVARNPVTVQYTIENGAPKAIAQALQLGRLLQVDASPSSRVEACAEQLRGRIIDRGIVTEKNLANRDGFDVGSLRIDKYELTFWNEYITLEYLHERIGTFPDLIATLSAKTGNPLTTAEIRPGDEVFLLWAPRDSLILGQGMHRPGLFQAVEEAIAKPVIPYVFPQ